MQVISISTCSLDVSITVPTIVELKLPEKLHIGNVSSNFLRVEWEEEKLFSEYRVNLIELDREGKEKVIL